MRLTLDRLKKLREDDGSALIETAVSLTLAFLLAFWLFELSVFSYTYAVLDEASHEGIRYAIAHGTDSSNCSGPSTGCGDSTGANVLTVVRSAASGSFHKMSGMTVQVTYPDATGSKPGSLVKIAITYPYVPYFTSLGLNQTASVSAQGRILF